MNPCHFRNLTGSRCGRNSLFIFFVAMHRALFLLWVGGHRGYRGQGLCLGDGGRRHRQEWWGKRAQCYTATLTWEVLSRKHFDGPVCTEYCVRSIRFYEVQSMTLILKRFKKMASHIWTLGKVENIWNRFGEVSNSIDNYLVALGRNGVLACLGRLNQKTDSGIPR